VIASTFLWSLAIGIPLLSRKNRVILNFFIVPITPLFVKVFRGERVGYFLYIVLSTTEML